MDDSINLSVSSLGDSNSISSQYKQAAKLFLNKKFDSSFDTLQPLLKRKPVITDQEPARLWTKIWSLYMAILDKSMNDTSVFSRVQRNQLQENVTNGDVWLEVENSFGSLSECNPDLILSLVTLSLRHCDNQMLKIVNDKLENYLSNILDRLDEKDMNSCTQLVYAYVTKLLPKLGEFEYAKEFASVNPFITNKIQVSEEIDKIRRELQQKEKQDMKLKQEQERLEKERVLKAEQQQFTSTPSLSEGESDLSIIEPAPLTPNTKPSQSPAGSQSTSPRPISSITPSRPRNFSGLIMYWKNYIKALFSSASFLKFLLFIVVILLSVTNPLAKARIKRVVQAAWAKLIQTISMGTKVSYV